MSSVRNCKRCGKVFVYVGIPICRECLEKQEGQYKMVKQYLDEHPKAGVSEVSDGTQVPVEVVVEFLRQGLLVPQSGPGGQLTCAICKKPILKGSLCPKCEVSLGAAAGLGTRRGRAPTDKELASRERMYVMDLIGKRKR